MRTFAFILLIIIGTALPLVYVSFKRDQRRIRQAIEVFRSITSGGLGRPIYFTFSGTSKATLSVQEEFRRWLIDHGITVGWVIGIDSGTDVMDTLSDNALLIQFRVDDILLNAKDPAHRITYYAYAGPKGRRQVIDTDLIHDKLDWVDDLFVSMVYGVQSALHTL